MAEKAKIDKMSMSDLKSQYSSVIGNYNTYIVTGYFNPLGIGENRAVIERYKILKAEEEAKAAAQAAELAKYHYLNIYKHIQETGLRPDGTPATDLEKKIAPYVVAIPIIQDLSVAFAGRQYAKHNPHIPIENGMKWGVGSDQKTDTGKVYGPQPADGPLQPLKPYGPEQYSGPLQPLETPKVKVDFYVNPNGVATKANLGDSVTLYRGERSTVSPDIVFDLGFKPKGTSGDLRNHLTSNTTAGNFVSTSADKGIATDFAGKNGYLYEISSNRGIDVNKTLGSESPYPEQMEFSIPYGISSSEIKGAWSINKGVVGDYISNPNFGGGR
ncbi:enterotoxin A family protein [Streptococcus suis]|uniref:enterotoxin A family protein n=1 Tax=Streptococcus suis TaxID=1307 RepID=UPI00209AF723|nr:enterotoxin A family protein [Streptococcus suis]MCO8217588.1 enterotoxin A family protein [Streptococcus suis]